jgi:hypothetical protein
MTNAKRRYEDKTLNKIDKSQLEGQNNSTDMKKEAKDVSPDQFTVKGIDYCVDRPIQVVTNISGLAETKRFAREHLYKPKKDE